MDHSEPISLALTPDQFSVLGERILKECRRYLEGIYEVGTAITPSTNSVNSGIRLRQADEGGGRCGERGLEFEDVKGEETLLDDPMDRQTSLPSSGEGEAALDRLRELFQRCCVVNGRFFGFVTGSGIPLAALADLVASVINQNAIAPFVAPAAVHVERTVVRWLAEAVGCQGFGGSLTGGGSASNIMGLAMARETLAPCNEWGQANNALVVYASKEVHMSIPKTMALLGLGRRNLRLLDVDDRYRLRGSTLAEAIAEDRKLGRRPLAVVGTAGSTRTGAVDALDELAEVAAKEGLWMHVDGAYGAFAASVLPDKFRGLNRADSISLDPHKWLYMPLDCGCLLVRRQKDAIRTFSYFDDYAKSPANATSSIPPPPTPSPLPTDSILEEEKDEPCMAINEDLAFYEESIELSRRFRALKIWLTLRFYGMDAFRNRIRSNLEQAKLLAKLVMDNDDLELMAPVELSVVCFRVTSVDGADIQNDRLDQFNAELLVKLIRRGRVYVSKVLVEGQVTLRACITNHLTTDEDVEEIVHEVLQVARESQLIAYTKRPPLG